MLDTTRQYETPEGIDLELHIAGPIPRGFAYAIDLSIRFVIYMLIAMFSPLFGEIGNGVMLISIFLLEWFYPVFFEVYRGATPGKKMFNLTVCHDNGTPIGWQASILRNLLRVADFLPFAYGLGVIAMLFNKDFKRLGDIAAGTAVIYKEAPQGDYDIPEAQPRILPVPLKVQEQRAILDFAERTGSFSQERNHELANLLQGLTQNSDEHAKQTLFSYANWLQKGND